MTREEAIEAIKCNWPDSRYTILREALDMAISALRQQDVADKNVGKMTNADRIRSMTDEELAEFLSGIAYGRETPWSEPFARRMCDSCQTVHGTYESGIEDDFHECDFVDGKCPHGGDIVWWLKRPAGEEEV